MIVIYIINDMDIYCEFFSQTQNELTKKLDKTTVKVSPLGGKLKVIKHTNVESQEVKKNDVTIVRRSLSQNKTTMAKKT